MRKMEAKSAFEAVIYKLQTLRGGDGTYRVTLDVPLTSKKAIKELFDVDEHEVVHIVVVRSPPEEKKKPEREVVTKRSTNIAI